MSTKRNALSRRQALAIADWLRTNGPESFEGRTPGAIAALASEHLGAPVTAANVLNLIGDMDFPYSPPGRRRKRDEYAERLAQVEERMGALEFRFDVFVGLRSSPAEEEETS